MNANRQDTSKLTILYARLSVEDEQAGDSNSIVNQESMLRDYAQKHGFRNIVFMADDGYSGTRFDRPSFNKMMDEVAAGNVSSVIIKDLSRFGRDHLRVGLYTDANVKHKLKKHEFIFQKPYITFLTAQKQATERFTSTACFYFTTLQNPQTSNEFPSDYSETQKLFQQAH